MLNLRSSEEPLEVPQEDVWVPPVSEHQVTHLSYVWDNTTFTQELLGTDFSSKHETIISTEQIGLGTKFWTHPECLFLASNRLHLIWALPIS